MSIKDHLNSKTKKDHYENKQAGGQKLLSEQNSPFSFYHDLDRLLETSSTLEDLFWQPVRRFLNQS
jgi:hypothetical protein